MQLFKAPRKPVHTWSVQDVIEKTCSIDTFVPNLSEFQRVTEVLRMCDVDGKALEDDTVLEGVLEVLFDRGIQRRRFQAQIKKWQKENSHVIFVRTSNGNSLTLFETREPKISLSDPVSIARNFIEGVLGIQGGVLTNTGGRHLVEERNFTENQLKWGEEIFLDLAPKRLPPDITLSQNRCFITLEDSVNFPRAQMPCDCRCAITPEGMTLHIAASLRRKQFDIFCPNLKCQCPWPWDDVRKVAVLTYREERDFEEKRRENEEAVLLVSKRCPNQRCGAPISRGRSICHARVRCSICSEHDICWRCLGRWKTSGFDQCGNDGCDSKILATCGTHDMYANKDVPIARSCPRCEQLIEHRQMCKHIHCSRCSLQFCMVCLKPRLNANETAENGWQCGDFTAACPDGIAPRQCV